MADLFLFEKGYIAADKNNQDNNRQYVTYVLPCKALSFPLYKR